MLKIELYGEIKDHKLTVFNRKRLEEDLQQAYDCEVEIIIKKRGRRSLQQLRYLFGVVYAEAQIGFRGIGYRLTIDQIHNFFKEGFLPTFLKDKEGKVIAVIPGSTTELNKEEMSEYVENIKQWCSEHLGHFIPDADQDLRLNF